MVEFGLLARCIAFYTSPLFFPSSCFLLSLRFVLALCLAYYVPSAYLDPSSPRPALLQSTKSSKAWRAGLSRPGMGPVGAPVRGEGEELAASQFPLSVKPKVASGRR